MRFSGFNSRGGAGAATASATATATATAAATASRRWHIRSAARSPSAATSAFLFALAAAATTSPPTSTSSGTRSFMASAWNMSSQQQKQQRIPRIIGISDCSADGSTTGSTTGGNDGNAASSPLASIVLRNSWIDQLSPETKDNYERSLKTERLSATDSRVNVNNRTKRPIFNGHYVIVPPTGIANPKLLLHSPDVAHDLLKFTKDQMESQDMIDWLSGNAVLAQDTTWATPYALSIMGTRYTSNCPYGTGNGYGDGRAVAIGEVQATDETAFELQLKGGGKTPFHRGADGRAVLRSSIREFLASEAMHYLGVRTTRALSLVVSVNGDTVQRPWYSDSAQLQLPTLDDPRLAKYSMEQRKQLLRQLRTQSKADPNIMIREPCAITCRVATSFTRIGHLDLFARRVQQLAELGGTFGAKSSAPRYDIATNEWKELEQIVWHACFREFKAEAYDPFIDKQDIAGAATKLIELSSERIADMVTGWVRVGFAQGNFNADNCLVGGSTMDYGPFGFLEEYSPLFAKWTGSGEHFGFLNQPSAGLANLQVLIESVVPVIVAKGTDYENAEKDYDHVVEKFVQSAQVLFQERLDTVFRNKMGLPDDADVADDLWVSLEPLLRKSRVDWTIFWRQLTYVARDLAASEVDGERDYEAMMSLLENGNSSSSSNNNDEDGVFYESLDDSIRREWLHWLEQWSDVLDGMDQSPQEAYDRMKTTNPKYVLREWMLVDAYTTAALDETDGEFDTTVLKELFELVQRPYDEGTESEQSKYYRRAPASALMAGGTAFMS